MIRRPHPLLWGARSFSPIGCQSGPAASAVERHFRVKLEDVVITGSLVPTKYPKPGDKLRFEAGRLGAVELQVE